MSAARLTPAERRARWAPNVAKARVVSVAASKARAAARLEDLEHLAAARVAREAAAPRAGFPTVEAMERFCRRMSRHDLIKSLPLQRSAA